MKRKEIQENFDNVKKLNPELSKYHLEGSDARLGQLVALAERMEGGTIRLHSNYMNYSEMNNFIDGILFYKTHFI